MLLSRKLLLRMLGALWLIDGLFQLQPKMFTLKMVNGIMLPTVQSQPAFIAANLQWIVKLTTEHLVVMNMLIALVQVLIGLGLLTLSGRWVKRVLVVSMLWALAVWYGGEGMSMLLTGQASVLTGAPGAVLFYLLLGLVVYPHSSSAANSADRGLCSRAQLRSVLAGFWLFAAMLQLQPYWWHPGQISQTIGAMIGQGGLDRVIIDPVLRHVSALTASIELPLNLVLVLLFLGLGLMLLLVRERWLRPTLLASIIVSLLLWYVAQGFGLIFTGMTTDFNSGLLLIVMTLACWPKPQLLQATQNQFMHNAQQITSSTQSA